MATTKTKASDVKQDAKPTDESTKTEADASAEEAQAATPADKPKDDDEVDGDEKKDDGKKAAAKPGEVAGYCYQHGAPQLAQALIESGATMDDVKTKVGAASEIRAITAAARNTGAPIDAKFEDAAIEKGMTVDEVRKALFDKMLTAQSPEIRSQMSASDIAGQTAGNHGWDKAFAKNKK